MRLTLANLLRVYSQSQNFGTKALLFLLIFQVICIFGLSSQLGLLVFLLKVKGIFVIQ